MSYKVFSPDYIEQAKNDLLLKLFADKIANREVFKNKKVKGAFSQ